MIIESTLTIPRQLIDEILKGNVVLFLGAGASYGATNPKGGAIPLGNNLRNMLVDKFLDDSYREEPLSHVAEVCINEYDLFTVQAYIKEIFDSYNPASHHLLIPQFKWRAIFTTNYDLIVEKTYESVKQRLQNLCPIVQNGPVEKIFSDRRNLMYFKLHGCIRYSADIELPFVLSLDQYASVHKKRDRLFTKLQELSSDHTFLFVGFSNSDSDIRDILIKLEELSQGKPRSYFVAPKIRPQEIRMLDSKKITAIPTSFQLFLEQLDKEISPSNRKLSSLFTSEIELPIYRKFVNDYKLQPVTNAFVQFINNEVDYVHAAITSEHVDPKEFYKGHFKNWDPIIKNLDVERNITDNILLKAFLDESRNQRSIQQLHIIKGNAGSGKSVLLKRIAWKAAVDHDKLCLFYKPNTRITYDTIYETFRLCKERIYLFVDNTIQYADYLVDVLNKARKDDVPITVVGCVRNNEYNIHKNEENESGELDRRVTEAYELTYLDDKEIRELISTLSKHKSLGHLEGRPHQEQIEAFSKKYGRELLVALYEATEGKSFAEIIADEYKGIASPQAQSLYLTVSILHRLGCKARAGFISRMHNISLSDFKEKLFDPLEHIVFDSYNNFIADFEYSTRHQQIAEMVFNSVLLSEQDRFDEYLRIVSFLDIDYENDRSAFRAIVNARKLKELFKDKSLQRELYNAALHRTSNDAYLYQQMGLFEMNAGNKDIAHKYLNEAKSANRNDLTVVHSLEHVGKSYLAVSLGSL